MGVLTGLDAAFLALESRTRPMHLGAVAVFQGPPPANLTAAVIERAARLPALRATGRWFPSWSPAPNHDPAAHVHTSTTPNRRMFDAYVAGWLATPLDLTRPPWDLHVVTGLPDEKFAVLVKLHHSLADGAGAVALAGTLLDGAPPQPAPPRSGEPSGFSLNKTAAMASTVATAIRRPPIKALLATGSAGRRVAFIRLDLTDIRQIRHQHGGTTNDVTLAVLTGGLREWLRTREIPIDGHTPRALVPVNTRARGGTGGNQLSGYLCDLPIHKTDPVAQLRTIRTTMDANKAAGPSQGAGTFPILANHLPAPLYRLGTSLIGRATPLLFDTVVTNVPLPPIPLTLTGCQLAEIYPFAPLAPKHALGVAISPYRDSVHIGLVADREALPDLEVLATCITKACNRLHESAQ